MSNYTYDAGGERVTKLSGGGQGVFVNSVFSGGKTSTSDFTLYVNPYLVAQNGGRYTKHIYIGSQRIVSKLGDFDSYGADPRRVEKAGESFSGVKVNYDAKYKKALEVVKSGYGTFEVPYYGVDNNDYVNGLGFCCNPSGSTGSGGSPTGKMTAKNDNAELQQFYYHPDHLGSSSYISNLDGEVVQHIEYVPFGEVFLEEKNAKWNTPYLFTSKELDRETGMYYFGARYQDPKLGIMMSVDQMAEKYPNWSSYNYAFNNPVKFVDPDGNEPDDIVIKGINNSSLTIKTEIDLTLNSNIDFKGNHEITDLTNLAIGYQTSGTVTSVAGVGVSGSAAKISTLFLGNKHAGYWYDYAGVEGQLIGATGFEVSAGVGKSWFLAVHDPKVKNTNNPEAFAGDYTGGGIGGSYEPLLGKVAVNGQISQSTDKSWTVYALGASVAVGPSGGIFAGGSVSTEGHKGTTRLITKPVPTKERSWASIIFNWAQRIASPL